MKTQAKKGRPRKHRGNGEGTSYASGEGGYRSAIVVGWKLNADGKKIPIRKHFRGGTAQEVLDKKADALKDHHEGKLSLAPEKLTIGQYLDSWLRKVKPKIRLKTYTQYSYCGESHIKPGVGHIALKKLRAIHVEEFLARKLDEKSERTGRKLSNSTVRHIRGTLKVALNAAVDAELISSNPVNAKLVKDAIPKSIHYVRFMSTSEFGAFLAAARGNWLEHAFTLALATGIREAELLGLQWDRIDLERREMRVEVQLQRDEEGVHILTEPKTEQGRRLIKLSTDAVRALAARKLQQEGERQEAGEGYTPSGFVFTNRETGAPIDQRTLLTYFYRARDAAGVKGLTFHGLRHTYASQLLAAGVPVKDVSVNLGHSDVAFTLRIYVHAMPNYREKTAIATDGIFQAAEKAQAKKEAEERKNAEHKNLPGAATGAAGPIVELAGQTIN